MKKRIMTLCLALVTLFGFGILYANAADSIEITIKGASNAHKYEAYQVFKGKSTNTNSQLVDIDWGEGVNGNDIIRDLVDNNICTSCTDLQGVLNWLDINQNSSTKALDDEKAQQFASVVAKHLVSNKAIASAFDTVHKITVSEEGYYFIKDKDASLTDKHEAYTRFILRVLGGNNSNEINVKADLPAIEKKVLDSSNPADSTVKEIGAEATYQLSVTLPNTLNDFKVYQLIFHDKLGAGLTYKENSYKVDLVKNGEVLSDITTSFAFSKQNGELLFTAADIKKISNIDHECTILLTYKVEVNANAVADANGNKNEAYITFSNNPNEANGASLGKSITDSATVYTYQLNIEKQDGRNNTLKLDGVEFKLCKDNAKTSCAKLTLTNGVYVLNGWGSFDEATAIVTANEGLASVRGLDKSTYYLYETKAKEGYNLLKDATEVAMATGVSASVKNITVDNLKGTLLPSTGGIGTVLFYVCGIALVSGSIYFAVANKKKEKDEK